MLTLSPNLSSAGLRPSLRAMSDSIFGRDVWHHSQQSHPYSPSYASQPPSHSHLHAPPSPRHTIAPSPYTTRSHSRSSSCSSVQSTRGLFTDRQVTLSPTLALARAFRPGVEKYASPDCVSPSSSSFGPPTSAEAWPSPRGIEYVRATVTLQYPPRGRERRPTRPTSVASPPDNERKGIQPLLLESKARLSSGTRQPKATKATKQAPLANPSKRTTRKGRQSGVAMQRTLSNASSASTEPETPTGLRPLILASKARPARSLKERAHRPQHDRYG